MKSNALIITDMHRQVSQQGYNNVTSNLVQVRNVGHAVKLDIIPFCFKYNTLLLTI